MLAANGVILGGKMHHGLKKWFPGFDVYVTVTPFSLGKINLL